jgi:hypothetical protein
MKRSPLRRKTPLKGGSSLKRTKLNPVSKKRKKQLNEYHLLRREFLFQNNICAMCKDAKSTDIHHVAGRWQERLNDKNKWQPLCRGCHDYIHRNPEWAYAQGWLEKR